MGGLFYALKSYFIRKVSRSITIAMIAMTSIAFSYFVTEGFLHSREIGGKPPHLSSFFCNSLTGKRIRYKDNPGTSCHSDVSTTMIYTHVLNRGAGGVIKSSGQNVKLTSIRVKICIHS